VVPNEGKHTLGFYEVDSEKDFASFLAFDRIDLGDRAAWMLIKKRIEILEGAAYAAPLVYLEGTLLLARLEPYLARKIDVLGRDGTCVDEAIDRPFTDHNGVFVVDADVMWRMVILHKGSDQGVKLGKLILRE
jgi:hypothetical protein